jgi:hypothetical protein
VEVRQDQQFHGRLRIGNGANERQGDGLRPGKVRFGGFGRAAALRVWRDSRPSFGCRQRVASARP